MCNLKKIILKLIKNKALSLKIYFSGRLIIKILEGPEFAPQQCMVEGNDSHSYACSLVGETVLGSGLEEVCPWRLAMMFTRPTLDLTSFSLSALCLRGKCERSAAILTPYIPVHCYASCLDGHVITLWTESKITIECWMLVTLLVVFLHSNKTVTQAL